MLADKGTEGDGTFFAERVARDVLESKENINKYIFLCVCIFTYVQGVSSNWRFLKQLSSGDFEKCCLLAMFPSSGQN